MATSNQTYWNQLSGSFAQAIDSFQSSVVAVQHGGRSTSSGVVWRAGVVVTTLGGLRHRDGVRILHAGGALDAKFVGGDPSTDLAVLRVASEELKPVDSTADEVRTGEVVLSIGRSSLGDISASSGIVARTGAAWRTWRGGQIDRLIRPDIRLYVGQSGSTLINEERKVLGINSNALARQAVITVPSQTVNRTVDAILERGHMPRPYLGVAMQPVPVPDAVRSVFAEEAEQALLVTHVEPNGPGAHAGIMVGDLIVTAGGSPISSVREILHRLTASRIGDTISFVVIRGGAKVDLTISIADRG